MFEQKQYYNVFTLMFLLIFTFLFSFWALPVSVGAEKVKVNETVNTSLINSHGKEVGTAVLTQFEKGVKIELDITNLPPGVHAFHIHEKGVCTPPGFESAGGHLRKGRSKHGFNSDDGSHIGDMANLIVNTNGKLKAEIINTEVSLKEKSLLQKQGSALVIHTAADDHVSDPSGNAGGRIACGVIKANEEK